MQGEKDGERLLFIRFILYIKRILDEFKKTIIFFLFLPRILSFFREKTPNLSGDGAYKLRGKPTQTAPCESRSGFDSSTENLYILKASSVVQ